MFSMSLSWLPPKCVIRRPGSDPGRSGREIVFEELQFHARSRGPPVGLLTAKLHAPDLSRDRLRQLTEFEPPNAFIGCQTAAAELEDLLCQFRRGLPFRDEGDKRLRYGVPHRVRAWHHGGLGYRGMLDQNALELKRADSVVRG